MQANPTPVILAEQATSTNLEQPLPTREELRRDPACEARRGIADRIGCRECGEFFTALGGKGGHLRLEHKMSVDQYKALYVGARIVSFNYYCHIYPGYEALKLMAKLAEDYATPEVRAECEKDPQYEEKRKLEFRICRACGRKSSRVLDRHLAKVHGWTLLQYRERYPQAPVATPNSRRGQMEWLREHPDVMKARNARSHANRQRKLEQVETLKQQIIEKVAKLEAAEAAQLNEAVPDPRITLAVCLELQGVIPYNMRDQLFPDVKRTKASEQRAARHDRVKKLFNRNRDEFERERKRITPLSKSEIVAVAENARLRIPQSAN